MVPEKSLLFSVVPLPLNVLLVRGLGARPVERVRAGERHRGDRRLEGAFAVHRAAGLLRRAHLLGDQHRDRVAHQPRAMVFEQRTIAVALEDRAVAAHRLDHRHRLDALGVEHLHRRDALRLLQH
jgi:hypothetical protein